MRTSQKWRLAWVSFWIGSLLFLRGTFARVNIFPGYLPFSRLVTFINHCRHHPILYVADVIQSSWRIFFKTVSKSLFGVRIEAFCLVQIIAPTPFSLRRFGSRLIINNPASLYFNIFFLSPLAYLSSYASAALSHATSPLRSLHQSFSS